MAFVSRSPSPRRWTLVLLSPPSLWASVWRQSQSEPEMASAIPCKDTHTLLLASSHRITPQAVTEGRCDFGQKAVVLVQGM